MKNQEKQDLEVLRLEECKKTHRFEEFIHALQQCAAALKPIQKAENTNAHIAFPVPAGTQNTLSAASDRKAAPTRSATTSNVIRFPAQSHLKTPNHE